MTKSFRSLMQLSPRTKSFWVACLLIGLLLIRFFLDQRNPVPPNRPFPSEGPHRVERVVDGDTLVIAGGHRVRLIGVDTPETVRPNYPVEPFGPEASAFTKRHVEGQLVRLEFDKERRDRYGRVLAFVYRDDDWFLNAELIRAGLSPAVLKYSYSRVKKNLFQDAEDEARRANRGIWSRSE